MLRYRRLTYRSTRVLTTGRPRPLGEHARLDDHGVVLAQPLWRPPTDIYETPTALTVMLELAGMEENEVEVSLFDDALVVQGHRHPPRCEAGCLYHAAEIRHGPFRVEIPLTVPIDPERVEAHYDRGLLRITLGKAGGSAQE